MCLVRLSKFPFEYSEFFLVYNSISHQHHELIPVVEWSGNVKIHSFTKHSLTLLRSSFLFILVVSFVLLWHPSPFITFFMWEEIEKIVVTFVINWNVL